MNTYSSHYQLSPLSVLDLFIQPCHCRFVDHLIPSSATQNRLDKKLHEGINRLAVHLRVRLQLCRVWSKRLLGKGLNVCLKYCSIHVFIIIILLKNKMTMDCLQRTGKELISVNIHRLAYMAPASANSEICKCDHMALSFLNVLAHTFTLCSASETMQQVRCSSLSKLLLYLSALSPCMRCPFPPSRDGADVRPDVQYRLD